MKKILGIMVLGLQNWDKIYLLFGPLSVHFRSLGERVFKPFS
jgi:hypothetical protein